MICLAGVEGCSWATHRSVQGIQISSRRYQPVCRFKLSLLAAMAPRAVKSHLFSWSQRLARHVEAGDFKKAMDGFRQMQQEGKVPDKAVFVPVLKACAGLGALDEGRRIHKQISAHGCESDVHVGSSLVDMYATCGSIEDSRKVFDKMPTGSVVTWNAMIHGYLKCGQGHKAVNLFRQMQLEGVEPDNVNFVCMLSACSVLGALEEGRRLHERIIRSGCRMDINVGNSLIHMYSKCGSMVDARKAFNSMPSRDVISYNAMIKGYAKCGQGFKALEISEQMPQDGVQADPLTLVGLVNACAREGALEQGRRVHEDIIQKGLESDIFVGSSLIDMYANCGNPEEARNFFDRMPIRNVVCWNAMVLGYVKCGQGRKSLDLYQTMPLEGVTPDPVTFVGLLKACANETALQEGRNVHKEIIQRGYESEILIDNSLIEMYAKCGSLEDARRVFDKISIRSVLTWNTMIRGCVKLGQGKKARELFQQMQREELKADLNSFLGVLSACATVGTLLEGKQIHKQIIENGYESNIFVGNSLIDMYCKCGSTLDARKVFNWMPSRNMFTWNSMILGYAIVGMGEKVLELSQRMQQEGMTPDPVTFVAMLSACACTRALDQGKHVHEQMIQAGCESEVLVGSSLVNMYSKCGSIEDAWSVFNKIHRRSVATWNAMIMAFANGGEERQALALFQQMVHDNVKPDPVTFVGVLKACGRLRVLAEGRHCHEKIVQNGFEFDIFVSNSLIDMYARCGSIREARKVFDKMPTRNVYSWNTMILEYGRCGQEKTALALSEQMQREGNPENFVGMLNVRSDDGALEEGICVHERMMRRWLNGILAFQHGSY